MRHPLLLALGLLGASLAAAPARTEPDPGASATRAHTAARSLRVAVLDLSLGQVEPRVGRVVSDSLVVELRKLDRVSAVSMVEVRGMLSLEAEKQLVGCDEASCLAEIADALGVDALVLGALTRVGGEHVIALRRIDQRTAQITASFQERLQARDGEEFLAAIGPGVERLFAERPLRPGARRGVDPEVARRLNPPPLPAWAFWSGVGVTGAGLLATAATAVLWSTLQADYHAMAEASRSAPVDGALLTATGERAVSAEVLTWSLLAASGALAILTAALTPLVDFWGYGEDAT